MLLFLVKTSNALTGNGFLWNMEEITIPLNSNFESYLDEFKVRFYYDGVITNDEVKVELDSFYYGSLTVSTDEVCDKEVALVAYVNGYSNCDRKSVIVHIKDDIKPTIKCIKELNININNEFEPSSYFSITDNAAIDTNTISYQYNPNELNLIGKHQITVSCSDIYGNLASRTFNYVVYDNEAPTLSVASKIEVDYGNIEFDIQKYIRAFDNNDGDLTNSVKVDGLDVFKIGNQNVKISVSDTNGNTTTVDKIICVVDLQAPILELTTYHDIVMLEDVKNINFSGYINKIYDNVDNLINDDVEIDTSDFSECIGENIVYFVLNDKNGNYVKRELIIDVRFSDSPIIDAKDLTFKQGESFDLRKYIKVDSKYDKNVADNYIIDEKVLNRNVPGIYEVIIEAMDFAGNENSKKIYVTIEANENNNVIKSFDNIYKIIYENKIIISIVAIGIIIYITILINKKRNKLGQ